MSCSVTVEPGLRTTHACGNSPVILSGTPMTPTSATSGWVNNSPSSSAGATCQKQGNSVIILDCRFVLLYAGIADTATNLVSIVFDQLLYSVHYEDILIFIVVRYITCDIRKVCSFGTMLVESLLDDHLQVAVRCTVVCCRVTYLFVTSHLHQ